MLHYVIGFLLVALAASLLGFDSIADAAGAIAAVLAIVFLVRLAVVSFRRRNP